MRGKVLAITQLLLAGSFLLPRGGAADAANSDLERTLAQTVRPFLTSYCVGCHGGATPAAQFDLRSYSTMAAVIRDYPRWNLVLEKLTARGDAAEAGAPAAGCGPQAGDRLDPGRAHERGAEERRRSRAGAGAPPEQRRVQLHHPRSDRRGHASHPRISGGSRQSGRLRQLRRVADHVARAAQQVPAGRARSGRSHGAHAGRVRFRAASDAGGDGSRQYAIQRIVDFYERQPTDYADYFQAAWRFKYRSRSGKPGATLAGIAARSEGEREVSADDLAASSRKRPKPQARRLARSPSFRRCGAPCRGRAESRSTRSSAPQCVEMRDFVVRIRKHTAMQFAAPVVQRIARRIAAAAELEAARIHLAPPRFRPQGPAQRYRRRRRCCPRFRNIPGLHQEAAYRWAALTAKARAGDRRPGGSGGRARPLSKPRSRASLPFSRTLSTSRSAAASSRTIRRTRDAC